MAASAAAMTDCALANSSSRSSSQSDVGDAHPPGDSASATPASPAWASASRLGVLSSASVAASPASRRGVSATAEVVCTLNCWAPATPAAPAAGLAVPPGFADLAAPPDGFTPPRPGAAPVQAAEGAAGPPARAVTGAATGRAGAEPGGLAALGLGPPSASPPPKLQPHCRLMSTCSLRHSKSASSVSAPASAHGAPTGQSVVVQRKRVSSNGELRPCSGGAHLRSRRL